MDLQPLRRCCHCATSYRPRSTALLFLALVLPATSFAQLTTSLPQTSQIPTTLSTSTIPSLTSRSVPTTTQLTPASTSTTSTKNQSPSAEASHAFNYYFLIIAGVVIIVCFFVLYIGRQKKRKAALSHTRGQRALARDVESWRSRFGMGRTGLYNNNIHDTDTEDGLNERGEAPPPYIPGSKPPSISSEELRRPSSAASSPVPSEGVELSNAGMNRSPPGYNENFNRRSGGGLADITRPGPVLSPSGRHHSIRRSTSATGRL